MQRKYATIVFIDFRAIFPLQLQSASPQSFNIFLQSFPGASRDAVIYHKMSVYVNFIAHKIKAEKAREGSEGTGRGLESAHTSPVTKCPGKAKAWFAFNKQKSHSSSNSSRLASGDECAASASVARMRLGCSC